jgi:hypothetical protein
MLIKAALREKSLNIFDQTTGRSLSFKRCVRLAGGHQSLPDDSAATLRAIGALRDDEQHYIGCDDEGIIYVHLRALVTLFDEILREVFNETLAEHLPPRMLPISTMPYETIDLLMDKEFTMIQDLLEPNRRRRSEARGKIRTLLAMEAHTDEDVDVSEKDVNRVEAGVRRGRSRDEVFPKLGSLSSIAEGEGFLLKVHFSKKGEGAPMRYVRPDDPQEAAAIREVDLQKRFPHSKSDLAKKLSLTTKRAKDLREKLGLDDDQSCYYEFRFGRTLHPRYSDVALIRLREELAMTD